MKNLDKYKFNKEQKSFLKKGYVIFDIKEVKSLKYIEKNIKEYLYKITKKNFNLNDTHKYIPKNKLNTYRLNIINKINNNKVFDQNYFQLSESILNEIIGNEIVMQNEISLSIQLPKDSSSLLPIHADTWSGNSPYEVVIWIPLVDVYKTKSMFILKNDKLKKFNNLLKKRIDPIKMFSKFKKDFEFLDIKFGQALIFNQNLPHGNVINKTNETRWSMNCRFKSLFSPYNYKKFGEVFKPVSIKPGTILGLNYKYPYETDENF
jgi:sporadic carbohydrate cluster 2OG-Fe(II) oxygenase